MAAAAGRAHVLVVTFVGQGNINPPRNLAQQIAAADNGVQITISVPVCEHRRMFLGLGAPDDEAVDGAGFAYAPYSDGFDNGFNWFAENPYLYVAEAREAGRRASLSAVIDRLAARGRPVTFMIYAILIPWVADVARDHGIPCAQFWSQPATVNAAYHYFFHGYAPFIASHSHEPDFAVDLPGLPPLKIRDLPSFLSKLEEDGTKVALGIIVKSLGEDADGARPTLVVLANTFEELEPESLAALRAAHYQVLTVGPVLPKTSPGADIYESSKKAYVEWLDTKAARSAVYVSFGSLSSMSRRQIEEVAQALRGSGRPYLWVLRKNNLEKEGIDSLDTLIGVAGDQNGLVVEWCDQMKLLANPAVGCFVTHSGWNSTMESIACGVPMVAVPQWTDQPTNANLVAGRWRNGVRAEVNGDGVLKAEELKRCLELVMGAGETGEEIRRNARVWKEKAEAAIGEGGSSERNFKLFMEMLNKAGPQ